MDGLALSSAIPGENMARMHSRKKGKSGSKKPVKKSLPIWGRYKPREIELLVVKLAKDKKTASQIGVLLRDTYGIPSVKAATGRSITQVLKEKKIFPEIPEDMKALIKRALMIRKHMEMHKKDMPAFRGLILTESKIRRLMKYYKNTGRLAESWAYDPEKMKLIIE